MSTKEYTMDVEEASSILMSLANSNPKRDSMSIRNLIDANLPTEMPSKSLQVPQLKQKVKRSLIHVHLSYKIHSHKIRMQQKYSINNSSYQSVPYHYKDTIVQ
ncbi:unnamed protein product [Rhizopus stolonifer]